MGSKNGARTNHAGPWIWSPCLVLCSWCHLYCVSPVPVDLTCPPGSVITGNNVCTKCPDGTYQELPSQVSVCWCVCVCVCVCVVCVCICLSQWRTRGLRGWVSQPEALHKEHLSVEPVSRTRPIPATRLDSQWNHLALMKSVDNVGIHTGNAPVCLRWGRSCQVHFRFVFRRRACRVPRRPTRRREARAPCLQTAAVSADRVRAGRG